MIGDRIVTANKEEGLSKQITNIFIALAQKHVTITMLRQSFINSIPANISYKEREEISHKMGQSVKEQLLYKKYRPEEVMSMKALSDKTEALKLQEPEESEEEEFKKLKPKIKQD